MKRKACSRKETGLSISAEPSTIPACVRNITLALLPASTVRATESKPPVRDTTFKLPATRRPSLSRRTAGVGSAKCALGARGAGCVEGREFMLGQVCNVPQPGDEITEGSARYCQLPVLLLSRHRAQTLPI